MNHEKRAIMIRVLRVCDKQQSQTDGISQLCVAKILAD